MQIKTQFCAKFSQSCLNWKKPVFSCAIPNITFDMILTFVNPVNGQTQNGEKCELNWNAAMDRFDTSKNDGHLPNWALDEIINDGQKFLFYDTRNKIHFRFCKCQLSYATMPKGLLTIKGHIKHKPGKSDWQCPC